MLITPEIEKKMRRYMELIPLLSPSTKEEFWDLSIELGRMNIVKIFMEDLDANRAKINALRDERIRYLGIMNDLHGQLERQIVLVDELMKMQVDKWVESGEMTLEQATLVLIISRREFQIRAAREELRELQLLCDLAGYDVFSLTPDPELPWLAKLKIKGLTERNRAILQELVDLRITKNFKITVELVRMRVCHECGCPRVDEEFCANPYCELSNFQGK